MDPVTAALLAAAIGSKMYGIKEQKEAFGDVRRKRNAAYKRAADKKKILTDKALENAKKTRSKFAKETVDDAVEANTAELTEEFSQLPNTEFAATTPAGNDPRIITTAANAANSKALGDINRYAADSANMTALTSAFSSPEQQAAALMNRSKIMEQARQQQALAQILGLEMGELSPYSENAEIAKGLGDILLTASMGVA